MSTTVGRSAPPQSIPPVAAADGAGRSAREALRRRRSATAQVVRLVILLLALAILVRGWQVTDINLARLANAPNAGPILRALVTPDVVTRDLVQVDLRAPFKVGQPGDQPVTTSTATGQTLKITPGAAEPGDSIRIQGTGFAPEADADLRLDFGTGRSVRFTRITTDSRGAFDEEREWPAASVVPAGDYTFLLLVNAPSGAPHVSETLLTAVSRIGETILLALMGTVFGVLLSVPFSFLAARNLMGGSAIGVAVYSVVRTMFTITRSIEVVILGVIMVVIVGVGSFAGVLAIVVHSLGSLGKLYSESIESIEPGPLEAITATGADRLQTVVFGVIPQVIPEFLAVTIYWWDHNLRMSTVIGLVGGGGIGFLLIQYMNLLQYNQAATVLWMIVIAATAMD
ncbi:MAG: phosphonate ABC transporter, permease protein PhnE, partial [Chloroflexota bacterium]|nr:phosphonate ABC transporter, permease protein PhnE [Chloroflexota bacterium]